MVNNDILLGQVAVGDVLPKLDIDMTTSLIVMGALASRDWQPQHHDRSFAQERNGTKDIFVNTNHNASLIERYVTDWTGAKGRLGKIKFKMKSPVFPGEKLCISGQVSAVHQGEGGIGWADVSVTMSVDGQACTQGNVRVALPVEDDSNPWQIATEEWNPDFAPLGA